jgi:hypothetical protein
MLRFVTHDWPVAAVKTMLRQLREASRAETKVVIVENEVLPYVTRSAANSSAIPGANIDLPPHPLLPGAGNFGYMMDMHVSF